MTIVVRPATLSDTSAIAHIGAHAFRHIPLMQHRYPSILPHDPAAWIPIRTARMAKSVLHPRQRLLVAYDSKKSVIVGYVLYERVSRLSTTLPEKRSLLMAIERALSSAVETLWLWAIETPEEKEREAKVVRIYKTMDQRSWGDKTEKWFCESLAVDEQWRGCGVGRKLLEEGCRWARAEGVPLVLEATEEGRRLYEKMNFKLVREAEMIEDIEMGCTMQWQHDKS
ncbi:acyl-CoA N-acyltransferase [Geopyxis carbonaria]|nr:acyl-CoA N-acyltransferase [Geopyxis carbonaria]